jgi:hypothetical protein
MADRTRTRLDRLHLADLGPQDHIAPNFRVYELDRSEVADRLDINNRLPDDPTLRTAVRLAREIMQPIREAHGAYSPLCVYRSPRLEEVQKRRPPGWESLSPHVSGCACDLRIPGISTLLLAQWAAEHLPEYDEVCCERVDPLQGPSSGWVHIALRPPGAGPNRRQLRTQIRDPRIKRWVILEGLHEQMD